LSLHLIIGVAVLVLNSQK